ncbi:Spore protein SP21 [Posidoniimonas polymericola]|uniref:Spore protein SP21 n=1 Tax=Posidoniimonas polymericola TaxID=2528002 RepID=A0A5C5YCR5_9BACT|nr:Hsp20/alpha crystallin family protein [Posidoniimonas polymericola]TWT73486.1 Spore protein SP21 [Posidoniimonas polymericola]
MLRSMVPWRERFPATFSRFENEMEDLMERYLGAGEDWSVNRFTPSLNVTETDRSYEVTAELPGLAPEDVSVEMTGGTLVVSGEKKEEKEEKGKTVHRVERRHGEFRRVVQLPDAADSKGVEATFEHGVLTVKVPKSVEQRPKKIAVKSPVKSTEK